MCMYVCVCVRVYVCVRARVCVCVCVCDTYLPKGARGGKVAAEGTLEIPILPYVS